MKLKRTIFAASAASLAVAPIAASAAASATDRAGAPIVEDTASELGGEGIGPALIVIAIAAAGMAVLLLTEDDDDEPISV